MFFQYEYLFDKETIQQNDPNGMHSTYDKWANINLSEVIPNYVSNFNIGKGKEN